MRLVAVSIAFHLLCSQQSVVLLLVSIIRCANSEPIPATLTTIVLDVNGEREEDGEDVDLPPVHYRVKH